jgi:hypothetical protein
MLVFSPTTTQTMTRRTLLEALSALFIPAPAFAAAGPGSFPAMTSPDDSACAERPTHPSGLEAWLRLPMQPLLAAADVPPACRKTAAGIFEGLSGGAALSFIYDGGSEPGTRRSAIPVLLFQKIDPDFPEQALFDKPVYLFAFCQTRNAPGIFRLDRMSLGHRASVAI